jgi:hypothetical protein
MNKPLALVQCPTSSRGATLRECLHISMSVQLDGSKQLCPKTMKLIGNQLFLLGVQTFILRSK